MAAFSRRAMSFGRVLVLIVLCVLLPNTDLFATDVEAPATGASSSISSDSLSLSRLHFRSSLLYADPVARIPVRTSFDTSPTVGSTRSVPLAFGLSALVPGAGQVYNKQWIKAAVAVALEVVFVATYISTKNEGNDLEDAYIAFAHEDWNPSQYGD